MNIHDYCNFWKPGIEKIDIENYNDILDKVLEEPV